MPTAKEEMGYHNPQQPWPPDLSKADQGPEHTEGESALCSRYHLHTDSHLRCLPSRDPRCLRKEGHRVYTVKTLRHRGRPWCITYGHW